MQPKTQGRWHTESRDDGSTWVLGPDPQTGDDVCVAAFEQKEDAEYVAWMHNRYRRRDHLRVPDHRDKIGGMTIENVPAADLTREEALCMLYEMLKSCKEEERKAEKWKRRYYRNIEPRPTI